jgi:hypothetical protein
LLAISIIQAPENACVPAFFVNSASYFVISFSSPVIAQENLSLAYTCAFSLRV